MDRAAVAASVHELPSGKRPSPTLRKALASAFAEDALATWRALGNNDRWEALDDACPWEADAALPWLDALPKSLAKELRKRTLGLLTRTSAGRPQLAYIVERGTGKGQHWHLALFVGGPPDSAPALSAAVARSGWTLPDALQTIYAVHNGLGPHAEDGFGVGALLASTELELLPAIIGTSHAGEPMVERDAFLGFFIDDVGHRRGLYRQGPLVYKRAFDWDRQTREATQLQKPAAVIGRELTQQLRAG